MNNKNYKQISMFSQVKLIRAFIIFNAFSFYINSAYSQGGVSSGSGGTSSNLMPVIASPNVAAFQKYGDLPVNHNTGVPQIQVPVYTISLNGFSWPISLSYHAGGFKSEDVATRTGLGWTLMGGGVISTKESLFDGTNYELTGDLDLGNYIDPLATSECSYNNPSDIDVADRIASGIYKVRPDGYYINAGGLNGKFMFDGGNAFMLPATDYKISSNGLVSGGYGHTGWTVYDNSGNKYEFLARGETSRTSSCLGWANMSVNVSYFLTKITTANNEIITFTYDTETYSYDGPKLHIVKSLMPGQPAGCSGAVSPEDYYCDNSVSVEEKRLKKITVSNGTEIDFSYSSRTDLPGSMKLDRVKVTENRNSVVTDIKDTYLNYSYFGTGSNPDNLQLKLNTVDFKDINSSFRNNYKFTYNTNPLPSKTSGSYWDGVYTISEAGLLEKLEYPTGGYTLFAYDVLPDYGTARIKEIKDYANSYVSGFRKFEYGLPTAGNFPREEYEQYHYFGNPANGNPITCQEAQNSGIPMTILSCLRTVKKSTPVIDLPAELRGTEISYSNITEYYGQNGENGKIEYTYGAPDISGRNPIDVFYLQNPLYLTQKKVYKKNDNGTYSILSTIENEYTVPATGNVFWSSKIFSSRVFLVTVLRPELTASCIGPGDVPYSQCFPKQYWTNDFKVTSLPVFLKKSTEETYSGTDKLTNITDYYYENAAHLNPTKVETKNSKNQVIETTTKYPYDFSGTAVYDAMITRNTITPIETIVRNATLNKELSRQKINFSFWHSNTIIAPGSVQQSVAGNSLETETTINSYTTNGRVTEIVGRDGVVTSYFWGYGDQYPVAKVTGKSYNDAVSGSSIILSVLNNPSSESSLRTETNKLRSVTGAFVTSYTYKPLIGMSSTTDINNNTSYYEYDGYNRLSLVRDKDNNIVKKLCYNFYGQVENCSGQSTNPVWMPNGVTRCKVCPTNSSFYSPMIETQEIDINPLSSTYGSPPRWVDYRYDESCLAGTDWITDNTIAPYCQQQSGSNTSLKVITEKNINPCSPYYNQTRPRLELDCSTCPKPAVWVATGYKICEMNGGSFTGNLLREEVNTINCSTVPISTIRYVFDSYNPTVCSATGCNNVTCTGEGYKCINNVCEAGIKVYTASNLVDPENWIYSCIYHYEFSDNSWSGDYSEVSYVPCL